MRCTKTAVMILAAAIFGMLKAQPVPATEWTKIFIGRGEAIGSSVQQTRDKGYIAAGWTWNPDTLPDFYLVKTDSLGNLQWQKTLGSEAQDEAHSVQQTKDGGYILIGMGGGIGSPKIYAIKTDSFGSLQWQKFFVKDSMGYGFSIRQTKDDGYIIGAWNQGMDSEEIYIIKTDSLRNLQWDKSFKQSHFHSTDFIPVQQTSDGGYVIGDRVIIKVDSLGNLQWRNRYVGQKLADALCVEQTRDGGFIATGAGSNENDSTDPADVYLLKTDSIGNLQWKKTFGGSDLDFGYWVRQTSEGGYIICGQTRSYNQPHGETYIIKTDSLGNQKWTKTVGLVGEARCIQQTADGGYIVSGYWSDFTANKEKLYLLKLAPKSKR